MKYEDNVRAILQSCFSQSKDEIIEVAVKAIMAIEPPFPNPRPNPYTSKTDEFDPKIGF